MNTFFKEKAVILNEKRLYAREISFEESSNFKRVDELGYNAVKTVQESRPEVSFNTELYLSSDFLDLINLTGLNFIRLGVGNLGFYSGLMTDLSINIEPLSLITCSMNGIYYGNLDRNFNYIYTKNIFSDSFNIQRGEIYSTGNNNLIGTDKNWTIRKSANVDFGARIYGGVLDLTNDATASGNLNGWIFAYLNSNIHLSSPWVSTLKNNQNTIEWSFKMRNPRVDPAGFGTSATYGAAFILAGSSNIPNLNGSGYAIVHGQPNTQDPVRLVRYTGGLQGTAKLTNIITGNQDFGNEYLGIKVTYNPSNDEWKLYGQSGTSFQDNNLNNLNYYGNAVDSTFTSQSNLQYLGAYWQASTVANQNANFDDLSISVYDVDISSVELNKFDGNEISHGAFSTFKTGQNNILFNQNLFSLDISFSQSFQPYYKIGTNNILGINYNGGEIKCTINGTGIQRIIDSNCSNGTDIVLNLKNLCNSSLGDIYISGLKVISSSLTINEEDDLVGNLELIRYF
jgi:hypothetical protein